MDLQLKNFKIWQDKKISISKSGVVLLSGKSGKGKSSILDSIAFCLYDIGRNLKSYGKKDLGVTLDFGDFIVKRTKSPNLLQYTDKNEVVYENELAQEMINKQFGEFFKEIGYISQNSFDSFIFKNPNDKLDFIERVLFRDTDIQSIKDKCKNNIRELNDILTGKCSNITYLIQKKNTDKLPEEIKFPLKRINDVSDEKLIDNQFVKIKNTNIIEKKINKQIDLGNNLLSETVKLTNNIEIFKVKKQQKEMDKDNITTEIINIEEKIKNINKTDIEKKICNYKKKKEYNTLLNKYSESKTKYDEMKKVEDNEKIEKIEKIEKKLWDEYTFEEANETLEQLVSFKEDMFNLENLQKKKEDLNKEANSIEKGLKNDDNLTELIKLRDDYKTNIEKNKKELEELEDKYKKAKQFLNVLRCPHCKKGVRYSNESLFVSDDPDIQLITKQDVNKIDSDMIKLTECMAIYIKKKARADKILESFKNIITSIEEISSGYEEFEIRKVSDIQEDIDHIRNYISENKQQEKEKKELELNNPSKVLVSCLSNIKDIKCKLDKIKFDFNECDKLDISEEEYINLSSILKNIDEYNKTKIELSNKYSKINNETCNINNELDKLLIKKDNLIEEYNDKDFIKEYKEDEDLIEYIKNKIKELNIKKEENKKKKENLDEIILNIEKYKSYKKEEDRYNNMIKEIESLSKDEIFIRDEIKTANLLKEKIVQAESLAICNFIDTLSFHVNNYLERFFKEDPLFVNIQNCKETISKKSSSIKHGIHITVELKGNECNLEHLSGGERDRISLAFTLALSEMFQNKILLLDECISSLDNETSAHVVNGLKDNYKNNLVIVVAHQVNEGLFDSVIKV
jgi:DNA repair exonuclease SbcCD ATPase subunit